MAHSTDDPLSLADEHQNTLDTTKASLERIKKQLTTSGRFLLQGSLLKRSETLRKWNQRWFTLDPTTGKMEYRVQRGDVVPKGLISFDANSTITVSPINFQGLNKYDGCCIYIETLQKREYFLCAETPGAARAWVSTLQAAQLVLKAHKDAVNSLSGSSSSKLGTVAAVVAAANATAKESAKEIAAAMQVSTKGALDSNSSRGKDGCMDDLSIMKETLKVKDEELHQLARELRARDSTIKEMADRLSETAEAAEAAASAAHIMDKERKAARAEIGRLRRELDDKLRFAALELRAAEEKLAAVEKARDEALQEAHTWRVELGKARENAVVMEAALVRAEESSRHATAGAEIKIKACLEREAAAITAKEAADKEVESLRTQLNSAVISGEVRSVSRDMESVRHQQPAVEADTDKQISMLYSSESAKPAPRGDDASGSEEGALVSPVVVTGSVASETDGHLASLAVVEKRVEDAFDATEAPTGIPDSEQQKAEAQDMLHFKSDKQLNDVIHGGDIQENTNHDIYVTVEEGKDREKTSRSISINSNNLAVAVD